LTLLVGLEEEHPAHKNRVLGASVVKLKFLRTDTDTDFMDAPITCNFVNVYTIVYHVQYTYTCKCAHPQRTSSRGKACVEQVDELNGPLAQGQSARRAQRQANGPTATRAGHADFRARILAQKSARISVSVSVLWNLAIISLEQSAIDLHMA